jgi:hypothetical protein
MSWRHVGVVVEKRNTNCGSVRSTIDLALQWLFWSPLQVVLPCFSTITWIWNICDLMLWVWLKLPYISWKRKYLKWSAVMIFDDLIFKFMLLAPHQKVIIVSPNFNLKTIMGCWQRCSVISLCSTRRMPGVPIYRPQPITFLQPSTQFYPCSCQPIGLLGTYGVWA